MDVSIEAAARAIKNATFILVTSGAGMSADAGLGVVKDFAAIPFWAEKGIDYHMLANASFIAKSEENTGYFLGWAAVVYKLFKEAKHHEGYNIVASWKQSFLEKMDAIPGFRERLVEIRKEKMATRPEDPSWITDREFMVDGKVDVSRLLPAESNGIKLAPCFLEFKDSTGNFMSLTSNIDSFWRRVLENDDIYEFCGNQTRWQCLNASKCSRIVWKIADDEWRWPVSEADYKFDPTKPVPVCPTCSGPLRVNGCLWEETDYVDSDTGFSNYEAWLDAMVEFCAKDKNLSLVVVELGAGTYATDMREAGEGICARIDNSLLIRINPDDADVSTLPEGKGLSIKDGACNALKAIDALLRQA